MNSGLKRDVILCVDDEQIILESLQAQLNESLGPRYRYEFAESAEDAWEIIEEVREERNKILLIVSDWLMPGTKGDQFLIDVHQRYPDIRKILLTGHANPDAVDRVIAEADLRLILHKPWTPQSLLDAIRETLGDQ